mmetsp:Transcript_403/g.390  ORF Transcript_403/g.390 Transcript_403/m.390 type:complete len:115 (-) Transcript_403:1-345(-)
MKTFLSSSAALAILLCLSYPGCHAFLGAKPFLSHHHSMLALTATSSNQVVPPSIDMADANHPLIKLTNEIIYSKSGFYSDYDESYFSEDFVFRGPFIGPLNKADYLEVRKLFSP